MNDRYVRSLLEALGALLAEEEAEKRRREGEESRVAEAREAEHRNLLTLLGVDADPGTGLAWDGQHVSIEGRPVIIDAHDSERLWRLLARSLYERALKGLETLPPYWEDIRARFPDFAAEAEAARTQRLRAQETQEQLNAFVDALTAEISERFAAPYWAYVASSGVWGTFVGELGGRLYLERPQHFMYFPSANESVTGRHYPCDGLGPSRIEYHKGPFSLSVEIHPNMCEEALDYIEQRVIAFLLDQKERNIHE